MWRIVITVFSWDNAHSAHCCLLSSSWASSEKNESFYNFLLGNFGTTECSLKKRCPSSLCRAIFHYRNILPPYFTHEIPLVLPADDMWANTGLCSCSGPWLPIHQPFIPWKWNKVTSGNRLPAGSKCSPAALHSHTLFLLANPSTGELGVSFPFPALHVISETHWLPNIETDRPEMPICLHDLYQSLSCHASH